MSNLPASVIDRFEDRENSEIKSGIQLLLRLKKAVIIVLDDDPTGSQYAAVSVLTNWEQETIRAEIDKDISIVYILTNSRSQPLDDAIRINLEKIEQSLRQQKDVVIYTSRKLISGHDANESLQIGNGICYFLVQLIQGLAYIVFPGNVGDERTLLDLYEKLTSTKLITRQ